MLEDDCRVSDENEDHGCKSFAELSQAVYRYLSRELSDGNILTVENIDATFFNYFAGVEEFYLKGTSREVSLNFSKFNYLADIYQDIKAEIARPNNLGSSNLVTMNKTRWSFENVFSEKISEKLYFDVKKALQEGIHSDFYREAIHSCSIFYPMLENVKKRKWYGRKTKGSRALDACVNLLNQAENIPFLINEVGDSYSLANYKSQCFYRDYEREALIYQTKNIRELDEAYPDF